MRNTERNLNPEAGDSAFSGSITKSVGSSSSGIDEETNRQITSSSLGIKELGVTITAGRTFVALRSVNGWRTRMTLPHLIGDRWATEPADRLPGNKRPLRERPTRQIPQSR